MFMLNDRDEIVRIVTSKHHYCKHADYSQLKGLWDIYDRHSGDLIRGNVDFAGMIAYYNTYESE